MAMRSAREKATGKGIGMSFAAIPRWVMRSEDFRSIGGNATKVLIWLVCEYRGKNNGDLSATFSQAKEWGIKGKDTLARALKELLKAGLIVRTREGTFLNPGGRCALYAVTWLPVDECPGKDLEIQPTRGPLRQAWPKDKKLGSDFKSFGLVSGTK